jgi:hypothetical protein
LDFKFFVGDRLCVGSLEKLMILLGTSAIFSLKIWLRFSKVEKASIFWEV